MQLMCIMPSGTNDLVETAYLLINHLQLYLHSLRRVFFFSDFFAYQQNQIFKPFTNFSISFQSILGLSFATFAYAKKN